MKLHTPLSVVLGGALASALVAVGMIGLAQRFDPVVQMAQSGVQISWEVPPSPTPPAGGVILDGVVARGLDLV